MRIVRLFLLLVIMVFTGVIAQAKASQEALDKEIFRLTQEYYSLGKQVIERLDFKVFEKQFLRKGDTLKYILKGSDGKLYLFKTFQNLDDENVPHEIFCTKFALLCGIPVSDCFPVWLPINDQLVYGSLQQIIDGLSELPDDQAPSDDNWLKYSLFRWLFDDPSPDLFLLPDKKIINIDLDKIRDSEGADFKSHDFGRFDKLMRVSLKKGKYEFALREAFAFIGYVESLPEEDIAGLFGEPAFYERIKALDLRKNKLRQKFIEYCKRTAEEEGVRLAFDFQIKDNEAYAVRISAGLKQKIAGKKGTLKILPKDPLLRSNLEIISSQAGVPYVLSQDVPINKLKIVISQRIEELKLLRIETSNTCERLALSLYLNRYRQSLPLLDFGVLPLERVQFIFHPEDLSAQELKANLVAGKAYGEDKDLHAPALDFTNHTLEDFYENYIRDKTEKIEGNPEWYNIMSGNCYLWRLDLEEALAQYNKIIKANNPGKEALFLAHLMSGYIYELNRQYIRFGEGWDSAKAKEEFIEAARINPRSNLAKFNLEVIDIRKEDNVNNIDRALDAEGNYAMALFYLIKRQYSLANDHIVKAADRGFDKELLDDVREEVQNAQ